MKRLMTGIAAMTLLVGTGFAAGGHQAPLTGTDATEVGYNVLILEATDGNKIHAVVSNEELKKLKGQDLTKGVNVKLYSHGFGYTTALPAPDTQ